MRCARRSLRAKGGGDAHVSLGVSASPSVPVWYYSKGHVLCVSLSARLLEWISNTACGWAAFEGWAADGQLGGGWGFRGRKENIKNSLKGTYKCMPRMETLKITGRTGRGGTSFKTKNHTFWMMSVTSAGQGMHWVAMCSQLELCS